MLQPQVSLCKLAVLETRLVGRSLIIYILCLGLYALVNCLIYVFQILTLNKSLKKRKREPLMSVTAWPVRHQTYCYLPSRKASPPIGWYQIILLVTEAHVC